MSAVPDAQFEAAGAQADDPPVARRRPPGVLSSQLATACTAAVASAGLAVGAVEPTAQLVVVAVLQAALVAGFALGTRLPGRQGAALLVSAAAVASDIVLTVWTGSALDPLLGVLALAMPALFAHQLVRGTGRLSVVASLSGAGAAIVAVACLGAWIQLAREDGGALLACGAAIAVGAALAAALVVDGIGLGPRIEVDSAPTVAGLLVGVVAGAVAGGAVLGSGEAMGLAAGFAVGMALSIVAVLLGLAATMLTTATGGDSGPGASARARGSVQAALRAVLVVVPVLAGSAPVAYVLCLAVQG